MTFTPDPWSSWTTDQSTDTPPSTATPYIDGELRNIKAQVKANVFPTLFAADYAGLLALLTTVSTSPAEITIDSAIAITADLTTPVNVCLRVQPGGSFAVANTKTFTPYGPMIFNPKQQIFSGLGDVDLSECPTKEFYPDNWGAVAGTVAEIIAGTEPDNAAVFAKMHDSKVDGKTITLNPGLWGIQDNVQFTRTNGFRFRAAQSWMSNPCTIWLNCGPSVDGLTIGVSGTSDDPGTDAGVQGYCLDNIQIAGGVGCCKDALKVCRNIFGEMKNPNIIAGAAGYLYVRSGCEHQDDTVKIAANSGYFSNLGITVGAGANGTRVCVDGFGWSNSTKNLCDIRQTGSYLAANAYGVRLEGTGDNFVFDADLENILPYESNGGTGKAIYATDCHDSHFRNIHGENTPGVLFERCKNIKFTRIAFPGTHLETGDTGHSALQTGHFKSCQGIQFDVCSFGRLIFYPGCRGNKVNSVTIGEPILGLLDYAGDTEYGVVNYRDNVGGYAPNMALHGENRDNQFPNTLLNRWQTDRPDGASTPSNLTVTKETGIVHNTTNSAKMVTSGGDGSMDFHLDAATLNAAKGQWITIAAWLNCTAAQSFASYFGFLQSVVTVPNHATGTGYKVGEGCMVTVTTPNDTMMVCTQAGTTAVGAPTFTATQGVEQADGTVKWLLLPNSANNVQSQTLDANLVDSLFHKYCVSQFIPLNATAANWGWFQKRQTGPANSTVYLAEPTVHIGCTPSRGIQVGKNEFPMFIQIGDNRMYMGQTLIPTNASSPLYALYARPGDVAWGVPAIAGASPGWVCITEGNNNGSGTQSVWDAIGNLAP